MTSKEALNKLIEILNNPKAYTSEDFIACKEQLEKALTVLEIITKNTIDTGEQLCCNPPKHRIYTTLSQEDYFEINEWLNSQKETKEECKCRTFGNKTMACFICKKCDTCKAEIESDCEFVAKDNVAVFEGLD